VARREGRVIGAVPVPRPPTSQIDLAFIPVNEERILLGVKFATTRRRRHGFPGAIFQVRGRWFRITRIVQTTWREAAEKWHTAEGLDSVDAFTVNWIACYGSRERIEVNRVVYVHVFVNADAPLGSVPQEIPEVAA
jgi:hypothetical protein